MQFALLFSRHILVILSSCFDTYYFARSHCIVHIARKITMPIRELHNRGKRGRRATSGCCNMRRCPRCWSDLFSSISLTNFCCQFHACEDRRRTCKDICRSMYWTNLFWDLCHASILCPVYQGTNVMMKIEPHAPSHENLYLSWVHP